MRVIEVDNVAQALPQGVALLLQHGERASSRAGDVLVAPWPVVTVYRKPTQRVVFSVVRDANPFFHMAESLWMLAGRNDAAFLNHFVRDFGARFAEPDGTIHGAYGHRWRSAFGIDQLDAAVETLKRDPKSRQCVLSMWDATKFYHQDYDTIEVGEDDLKGAWLDRPCNTHCYLRIRGERGDAPTGRGNNEYEYDTRALDLTVLCRSNDIVWGAYGANAVHMSVLQEYLASRIGVGVGVYYQVSNNYHAYLSELMRLIGRCSEGVQTLSNLPAALVDDRYDPRWEKVSASPLVTEPETFDSEVKYILTAFEYYAKLDEYADTSMSLRMHDMTNTFLTRTAWPMMMAHRSFKLSGRVSDVATSVWVDSIEASDWRTACQEWLQRRMKS